MGRRERFWKGVCYRGIRVQLISMEVLSVEFPARLTLPLLNILKCSLKVSHN